MSAGGANRTSLNGAMSRIHHHPPDDDCLLIPPRRSAPSGSDLMPAPRASSFRPFNSRLQPVYYQSPPRYVPQWQPPPPPPPQNYIPPQYSRREAQTVDKRKPIPRKGMFQNAKYSEAPPPPAIDEDQIRHTEDVITRMIERSRRNFLPPQNSAMRDSIRRAVYNLGVPDGYRAQGQDAHYENYEEDSRRPPDPRRRRQEFCRHSRGDRGDRREDYEEEEEEDFELEKDGESLFSAPKKSKEHRKKKQKHVEEEYEDDDDVEETPPRPSRKLEKQKRKRLAEKEGDTSEEESMLLERSRNSNSSRTSRTSKAAKSTPRPPSRGSKSSRNSTPKPPSPVSGPYIKDSDDDDNWRDSLPFMCAPNGAGAAMLERIGSAITTLPLRDDTKNSYSEVAMMLLGKSLKKLQTPRNERDDEDEEGLQSQLMNMSTCWARNPQPNFRNPLHPRSTVQEEIDEVVAETRKSSDNTQLLRDISRIQHPDNASTLQIDQSVFAIPQLLEVDRGIAEDWERGRLRKKKKKMPPPLFQSSPVSNDALRKTEEYGITQPSSIRKGPEEYGIIISDDEEDPKQFDIDDYIARGASQLNFSILTADPDASFFAPPPSNNNNNNHDNNNDISSPVMSPRNFQEEVDIESYPKSPEPETREFEIETTSKAKSDNTTNEFNSRFMFSPSRKKRKIDPTLDIEDAVQRIVDEVYDSDQANRQKYLF